MTPAGGDDDRLGDLRQDLKEFRAETRDDFNRLRLDVQDLDKRLAVLDTSSMKWATMAAFFVSIIVSGIAAFFGWLFQRGK